MTDFDHIHQLLQTYFDGLHRADTTLLKQVFHPRAHYYCEVEGKLLSYDMPTYFDVVDKRISPAALGHARTGRVVSISLAGPTTALAVVECAIPPKSFRDYLSMLKVDGRWSIVSKVFHQEMATSTA